MEKQIKVLLDTGEEMIVAETTRMVMPTLEGPRLVRQLKVLHPDNDESDGDYFYFATSSYKGQRGLYMLPLRTFLSLNCPEPLLHAYFKLGLGSHVMYHALLEAILKSNYFICAPTE